MMAFFMTFFEGILLGLGAAVPLGPINILIMNEALKSYKNALLIGLGAMSADATYLGLIIFGVTHFFKESIVFEIVLLFGALFLLFIAFEIFASRHKSITANATSSKNSPYFYYTKGYLLTLLNPYTMLFWLSLSALLVDTPSPFAYLAGMLFAIAFWIVLMPLLVHSQRALISQRVSYFLSLFSTIIIASFGFTLLFKSKLTNFLY